MSKYIIKSTLAALITFYIVITITFFLMQAVPGGPFTSERPRPEYEAAMRLKYGLDQPVGFQYLNYIKAMVQGDLGISYKAKQGYPVAEIITGYFPMSFRIGIFAFAFAVIVGIPLGIFAALKSGSWIDRAIVFFCSFGISVPSFILATVMILVFGVNLKWLPFMGIKSWMSYIMPVFCMGVYPMAFIVRLMRSNMLDVLGQDYIKTARAKGLPERKVLYKHALRNAMLPVITYLGPLLAGIITGSFTIEKIFTIPGLGKFFIDAISARDYPMIMGTTIFYGFFLLAANLVVDLLYGVVDPRIKRT